MDDKKYPPIVEEFREFIEKENTMEKADTIVPRVLKEILVAHQKNAGKDYYYPRNELAEVLVKLMGRRKALVPADFEALKELGDALNLDLKIKTISQDIEL